MAEIKSHKLISPGRSTGTELFLSIASVPLPILGSWDLCLSAHLLVYLESNIRILLNSMDYLDTLVDPVPCFPCSGI